MEKFQITLKNGKVKLYNRISWIILFIHLVVLLYLALFFTNKKIAISYTLTLIVISLLFILKYILHSTKTKHRIHVDTFFFLLMVGFIVSQEYWISIIPAVFFILSSISVRKLVVLFSAENIIYPSFPAKTIQWNDLENVILKDGLLTIDFRNNKLIQQHIDERYCIVNETEFNDFCRKQLLVK